MLTLKQVAERHPAFTSRKLYHLIQKSKPSFKWVQRTKVEVPGNGFDSCYRKVGRAVLVFEDRLLEWVDNQGRANAVLE